jgi:hypothetical protein
MPLSQRDRGATYGGAYWGEKVGVDGMSGVDETLADGVAGERVDIDSCEPVGRSFTVSGQVAGRPY